MHHHQWRNAFSLIEVTIALGIVSFALLAVIGLLPAGLKSVKNANEQAGAASVLNVISTALQNATPDDTDPTKYTATVFSSNTTITFSKVDTPDTPIATPIKWENLTLEGTEVPAFKQLSAVLSILAQPTSSTPGRATISVSWSAQANPTWDDSTKKWNKAEGSITSGIQFLPKQ